ncbi:MAG: histidine phosphatase family protein [Spirochaetia bacterium]|nr:histidine phosphatase family protein [Spirochaetia bacterium]
MRLYIIRHADPDYPNNTITPAGHLEAKALAQRLQFEKISRIFSSPLGRALDTMKYSAEALGLSWTVEEWTQELSLGARISGFSAPEAAWNQHPELIRKHRVDQGGIWRDSIPPIETVKSDLNEVFDSVKKQSDQFLKRLGFEREGPVYRVVKPNQERVAVFCHGGFGLTWLAHLLDVPLPVMYSSFFLPTSSVSTILMEERSGGIACPRAIGLADLSHLYGKGLGMSRAGMVANTD